jgi:transposase
MHARTIRLHHKTVTKLLRLKKEAEEEGEHRVARRIHAVVLNSEGYTSGDLATILKVGRSRVSEWLANYEQLGYEGLLEGFRPGRPPLLTEKQLLELADIVESGPIAYGYDCGVWTSPMIGQVIENEFGIAYHPGHVRKMLHHLGFSVQRPKKVLARADPEAQDKWHRYTFPNLKKKPGAKGSRSSSRTKRASGRTRPSTRRGAGSADRLKSP